MIVTPQANKVLELYTGKIKSITGTGLCYIGFSSTTPNDDGSNFTEPSPVAYPSYRRELLNVKEGMPYADYFTDVVNGAVSNAKEFCSAECKESGGWPTFTHFGLFDAETGGNMLAFDLLRDPEGVPDSNGLYPAKALTVTLNHVAVFRIGTLQLSLK